MTRPPLLALPGLLLAFSLALAACDTGNAPATERDGVSRADQACSSGDEESCRCGSERGTRTCGSAGRWSSCRCDTPSADAGRARGTGDDEDTERDGDEASSDDDEEASRGEGEGPRAGRPDEPTDSERDTPKGGDEKNPLPCDVAALLREHCTACHAEEPAFGAPMPLVTWADLTAPAKLTKNAKTYDVSLERMRDDAKPMPPAPHARLSAAELRVFEAWVESGAEPGRETCAEQPKPSEEDGLVPLPEDCDEEFELLANGGTTDGKSKFKISANPALEGNQYHCFYFDPPYASDAAMFGFQPVIDNKAAIHHWILYATDNKTHASGTSAPCNAAEPGAYFVSGWAPGADNATFGDDVALQLPTGPRAGLILEVHYYNNTGKPQEDASGIRFCTGKKSKRAHLAGVHTLGSEGICVAPSSKAEVVGICEPRETSRDIHITGVWPHMHKLARRMTITIKRRGGSSEVIHDEPFDFNSQVFFTKDDIIVKPGDTIETRCFFENDTAMRVKYGERTQDEMCYAFVVAWPAGALVSAASASITPDLLNRCTDPLSILRSCNGLADRPTTVEHPD